MEHVFDVLQRLLQLAADGQGIALKDDIDLIGGSWNAGYPAPGYVFLFTSFDPLVATGQTISAGTGGSVTFYLEGGPHNMNRNYLLLGGVTGTTPGTPLPGGFATLPINWDVFSSLSVLYANTSIFQNFFGTLDKEGKASAQFNLGALPGFGGTILHFAYALNMPFDYASNAVAVDILP